MVLVVDSNIQSIISYKTAFSIFRKREDVDYMFATNYEQAHNLFSHNRNKIKYVILDHQIDGGGNGAMIASAIRSNRQNDQVKIIRCSNNPRSGYPYGIPYWNKKELRSMLADLFNQNMITHPCIFP